MASKPKLLIASTNAGKVREVCSMLGDFPVELVSLSDLVMIESPVEDADSFEGNARLKALYYARTTNLLTLADDSGLEVDALNGAPGIYSSRFAGLGSTDQDNNAKLISQLKNISSDKRTARFRCVIALANSEQVLATATGSLEGFIVDEPAGENGFGYDPHFWLPELGLTVAQLSPEHKNKISHRGRALAAFRQEAVRFFNIAEPN